MIGSSRDYDPFFRGSWKAKVSYLGLRGHSAFVSKEGSDSLGC